MSEPPIVPGSSEPYTLASIMPAPDKPPRRRGWTVPVLAGLVVLLLGAVAVLILRPGNGPSEPAPAAQATTTAAATPTTRTATVGQYAGIVNASRVDIEKTWSEYDRDCMFRPTKTLACQLKMMSIDVLSQTLVIKLRGAAKPGVPAFIGAPPTEIEQLVADTMDAAQKVDDAIPPSATGPTDEIQVSFAVGRLTDVFNRWAPYI